MEVTNERMPEGEGERGGNGGVRPPSYASDGARVV